MANFFVAVGAANAALAVALGAIAAHALRSRLSVDQLRVFTTAVDYQMIHALGLILIGLLAINYPDASLLRWSGWLMAVGILLFSGSLYLLLLLDQRGFGLVTPFGGIALIAAWGLIAVQFIRLI